MSLANHSHSPVHSYELMELRISPLSFPAVVLGKRTNSVFLFHFAMVVERQSFPGRHEYV